MGKSDAGADAENPGAIFPRRIACVVPGCRRGRAGGKFPEFVCATHWPLTDRRVRRLMFRARRRANHALAAQCWTKLKRQAIERAAGL